MLLDPPRSMLLAHAAEVVSRLGGGPALAEQLAGMWDRSHARWPEVAVSPRAFFERLGELVTTDGADVLANVHSDDMFLACAVAAGDRRALEIVEASLIARVGDQVAQLDASPAFADDVRQALRHRLFVGEPDKPPAIVQYAGRGPLAAWMRRAAVRIAHDLIERRARDVTLEAAERVQASGIDPELDYIKTRYAAEFRHALEQGLAALPQKDRNMLRLYFLDGLTLHAIGRMYGVHETTAVRWLARLRTHLLADTRKRLRERLRLSAHEFESLMAAVESRLDLSMSRLLR